MEWFNQQPMKRSTLRRVFYLQCYALTPVQLTLQLFIIFFQLMTIVIERSGAPDFMMNLHYVHIIITYLCIAVLTFFYETLLFHTELRVSWPKALWIAVVSFFVFGLTQVLIFVIAFIAALIYLLYNPPPM
jgi:hypothetical protein